MAQDTKWSVHDNIWHFSVTDPHLHTKGFTIYKVTCKTFPIRSPETLTVFINHANYEKVFNNLNKITLEADEVVCWKRYNDFKTLHKSLLALHRALHRRDQFPEFAKPKLFGRFDENVVEERRLSALELLNFVATQPHLYKSLVFKQFLEEGRIHSDFSLGEPLMAPTPSSRDIISSGLSNNANPTSSKLKVDVQQESKIEVYPTSVGKLGQERKEQTAGVVCGNGTSQNNSAELAMLEGTWNFPQVADNISLSSSTGDDIADTDDESLLGTSWPDTDLTYFDPIGHDSGMVGMNESSINIPRSNSWLLEGLNLCAVMDSKVADNHVQGEVEGETLCTPVAAKSLDDPREAIMSIISMASSTMTTSSTLEKLPSHPSSPASSSRKESSGSGTATPGKSIDLEEFDPIRRMSQSSDNSRVECGKGDLDLSMEWQRSQSFASDVSADLHGSQSSSVKTAQDTMHSENINKPSFRSQSVDSDKSQDSEKTSSNRSTPMRTSRSLLKRLVSGSPVSQKPRSVTEQNVSSVDLSGKEDYIYLAASQICMAQNSEVNGDYEVAFAYYKSGVGILLQGVQGDTNQSRRDAVRRKTAQYLMKAEDLFNRHLANEKVDERRWGADSFLSPSLDLDPSFAFIRGSVRELRNFQVLGIIDKVVLVQDKVTDETFVIKSIPKSTPDVVRAQSILPTSCPHMVSLHKFYETDDSMFLLLQYASGGKLWTYIGDYLNRDRSSQTNGDINLNAARTNVKNIYSGSKVETANKDEEVQHNHPINSSKLKGVLNKELGSSRAGSEWKSGDSSEGHVQSTEATDVRFSTLKEKSELCSGNGLIKESSHNESFDAEDDSGDGLESHDMFNDSDLNEVLRFTHKKHSLIRRFSSLSDDCAPINEGENSVITPTTAPEEDHFQSLLHENRGNLEAFSINSLDSEDTHRNSLSFHEKIYSTSEHLESVRPPKHITSRQISADEVFTRTRRETLSVNSEEKVRHASTDGVFSQNTVSKSDSNFSSADLIRNSKELLEQVEKVLAETDDRISGEVDGKSSENHDVVKPSSYLSNDFTQEPSIYDVSRSCEDDTSNEDSDKNSLNPVSSDKCDFRPNQNNLNTSHSLDNAAVRTNEHDVEIFDSKRKNETEEVESPVLKTESEYDCSKHPTTVTASSTSSCFRQTSNPRKLSLSRMNSKDMTRSASFKYDLKSPTRNRARVVSDMFERLDSINLEQVRIPESSIRKWMAQLVTAVSRLHSLGIVCRDLKPSNVLLGEGGQVYLTYFCSLGHDYPEMDWDAVENLYAAPEVGSINGYDKTCDWWSIGALLYELVVGRSLIECHPGGINSHTCLHVPTFVSNEARGLLEGLLRHNPNERLGAGMAGSEEIKAHPFFAGVDWHTLEYS